MGCTSIKASYKKHIFFIQIFRFYCIYLVHFGRNVLCRFTTSKSRQCYFFRTFSPHLSLLVLLLVLFVQTSLFRILYPFKATKSRQRALITLTLLLFFFCLYRSFFFVALVNNFFSLFRVLWTNCLLRLLRAASTSRQSFVLIILRFLSLSVPLLNFLCFFFYNASWISLKAAQ